MRQFGEGRASRSYLEIQISYSAKMKKNSETEVRTDAVPEMRTGTAGRDRDLS